VAQLSYGVALTPSTGLVRTMPAFDGPAVTLIDMASFDRTLILGQGFCVAVSPYGILLDCRRPS
jgi:hypothetical protein